MANPEQLPPNKPDTAVLPDVTLQSTAGMLTDTIRDHVSAALRSRAAIVRIGEFGVRDDAFEAIHRDPNTQEVWTYRRKPVLGGTSWTVSREMLGADEGNVLETVRVVSKTLDYSRTVPSIDFSRVGLKFEVLKTVRNTEEAVTESEQFLSQLPTVTPKAS